MDDLPFFESALRRAGSDSKLVAALTKFDAKLSKLWKVPDEKRVDASLERFSSDDSLVRALAEVIVERFDSSDAVRYFGTVAVLVCAVRREGAEPGRSAHLAATLDELVVQSEAAGDSAQLWLLNAYYARLLDLPIHSSVRAVAERARFAAGRACESTPAYRWARRLGLEVPSASASWWVNVDLVTDPSHSIVHGPDPGHFRFTLSVQAQPIRFGGQWVARLEGAGRNTCAQWSDVSADGGRAHELAGRYRCESLDDVPELLASLRQGVSSHPFRSARPVGVYGFRQKSAKSIVLDWALAGASGA